jgi:hypothetical protein
MTTSENFMYKLMCASEIATCSVSDTIERFFNSPTYKDEPMNHNALRKSVLLPLLTMLLSFLTACGGNAAPSGGNPGGSASGFQFTITGDIEATMNVTNSQASIEPIVDEEEVLSLYFTENTDRLVVFVLPPDVQAGEYDLTETSSGVQGTFNDSSGETTLYFAPTGGTLNLTQVGESFSGSFEFTAADAMDFDGDAATVIISGSFSNVPLRESTGSAG